MFIRWYFRLLVYRIQYTLAEGSGEKKKLRDKKKRDFRSSLRSESFAQICIVIQFPFRSQLTTNLILIQIQRTWRISFESILIHALDTTYMCLYLLCLHNLVSRYHQNVQIIIIMPYAIHYIDYYFYYSDPTIWNWSCYVRWGPMKFHLVID